MFLDKNELDIFINKYLAVLDYIPAYLIVVMRYGYTEKECLNENYSIEILEYDGDNDIMCWLNDWFEGQQFIDVYDIYSDDVLTKILTES